jgi:hypothetical protein
MKWKTAKHGDIRTRRVFAWLPTEVEDHTVWLEQYQVTEEYTPFTKNYGEGKYSTNHKWQIVKQEPLYWV